VPVGSGARCERMSDHTSRSVASLPSKSDASTRCSRIVAMNASDMLGLCSVGDPCSL